MLRFIIDIGRNAFIGDSSPPRWRVWGEELNKKRELELDVDEWRVKNNKNSSKSRMEEKKIYFRTPVGARGFISARRWRRRGEIKKWNTLQELLRSRKVLCQRWWITIGFSKLSNREMMTKYYNAEELVQSSLISTSLSTISTSHLALSDVGIILDVFRKNFNKKLNHFSSQLFR